MNGYRKQYRICTRTEWPTSDGLNHETIHRDKRRFTSRKAAEKRLLVFGEEPWLAFGKGPEDPWCWGSHPCDMARPTGARYSSEEDYECHEAHTTAREFFDAKRADRVGRLLEAWIEERTVSPWSRTSRRAFDVRPEPQP